MQLELVAEAHLGLTGVRRASEAMRVGGVARHGPWDAHREGEGEQQAIFGTGG